MRKHSPAIPSESPTHVPVQQRCLVSAALLYSMLLALSAFPETATVVSGVVSDKLLRFAAYASLSVLIYAGLSGGPAARAVLTLALVSIMGSVEEAIQLMLPYHSANLLGWKFDMLVALTCVGMLMVLHPVFAEWFASQRMSLAKIRTRTMYMRMAGRRRNVQ